MANILIHNISDRTPMEAMSVNIGHIKIRPGKSKHIPEESINQKTKLLHGSLIWIGNLPPGLIKKKVSHQKALSMDREQASSYLQSQSLESLQKMLDGVTPAVIVRENAPHRRYVYTLLSVCYSDEYTLDPSLFYWLGRWTKLPSGDYQEA